MEGWEWEKKRVWETERKRGPNTHNNGINPPWGLHLHDPVTFRKPHLLTLPQWQWSLQHTICQGHFQTKALAIYLDSALAIMKAKRRKQFRKEAVIHWLKCSWLVNKMKTKDCLVDLTRAILVEFWVRCLSEAGSREIKGEEAKTKHNKSLGRVLMKRTTEKWDTTGAECRVKRGFSLT